MGTFTTAATTASVGGKITASNWNAQVKDFINGFSAMTSYTPTVSGFTTGNGTVTGGYLQVQKLVMFRASLTFGTTTTAGSSCVFTLPVTASASQPVGPRMGFGTFTDATGGTYDAILRLVSTTTAALYIPGASGIHTSPSTTTPFTWTTSDSVTLIGTYEAA